MSRHFQLYRYAFAAASFLLLGFQGEAKALTCDADLKPASIAGTFVDDYGGLQSVSADFWVSGGSVFEVCAVDESKKQILAKNSDRNEYNPGKYSRFDWLSSGNRVWYCQASYDAPSLDAAAAAPTPVPNDPNDMGCGTFAWSSLIKLLP